MDRYDTDVRPYVLLMLLLDCNYHCQLQPTLHEAAGRIWNYGRLYTTANYYRSSAVPKFDATIDKTPKREYWVKKTRDSLPAKQKQLRTETWKANNRTGFFQWWLGPIYGHMGLVGGDVPVNKPGHNSRWAQSSMYSSTEQATGSQDTEFCYRRAIITTHKACSSKGTPQRSPPTKQWDRRWESIIHFVARLRTIEKFGKFFVTCLNKPDCGQHIDYSSDMVAGQMVAGLANIDHQTKMLAEAAILIRLQQKFDITCQMTNGNDWPVNSPPHFSNNMHCTTTAKMQKNYKKQSQEVRISPTPQFTKPCRGYGRYSHPNRSRNHRDCLAAKMVCFNSGIVGHIARVCQTPKRGSSNRSAAISTREESCIFAARVYKGSQEDWSIQ